jgi:hypothetical protein
VSALKPEVWAGRRSLAHASGLSIFPDSQDPFLQPSLADTPPVLDRTGEVKAAHLSLPSGRANHPFSELV